MGFRVGGQCADVAGYLAGVLRKGQEWRQPIVVVSMDIAAAFDSVRPDIAARCLRSRGASTTSAAAWLRENTSLQGFPRLGRVEAGPIPFDKGTRQGGPGTLAIWSTLLADAVQTLTDTWTAADRTTLPWMRHGRPDLGLLVWVDNFFFVAATTEEAQRWAEKGGGSMLSAWARV